MRAVLIALAVLSTSMLRAAEPTVQRYVEFRDGTVLHVAVVDDTWKVPVIKAEGKIGESTVRLADFEALYFTAEPVFEKKKALLTTIAKLGSEDFDEREKAQQELVKMGPAIRRDLELLKEK